MRRGNGVEAREWGGSEGSEGMGWQPLSTAARGMTGRHHLVQIVHVSYIFHAMRHIKSWGTHISHLDPAAGSLLVLNPNSPLRSHAAASAAATSTTACLAASSSLTRTATVCQATALRLSYTRQCSMTHLTPRAARSKQAHTRCAGLWACTGPLLSR